MAAEMKFVRPEDAKTSVIDMRSELRREYDTRPKRITHHLVPKGQPWPKKTKIHCFHDCHPFDTMPVPLIVRYDHQRRMAVGFGFFCSPNCGRAYALDHSPIAHNQAMVWYSRVLEDNFGIPVSASTRPAPPKECLKIFGGDKTIEEYRASFLTPTIKRLETVSFAMQGATIMEIAPEIFEGVSVGADPEAEPEVMLGALASRMIKRHKTKHDREMMVVSAQEEEEEEEEQKEEEPKPKALSMSALEQFIETMRAMGVGESSSGPSASSSSTGGGLPDVEAPVPDV